MMVIPCFGMRTHYAIAKERNVRSIRIESTSQERLTGKAADKEIGCNMRLFKKYLVITAERSV